jgi:hypothetical protein
VLYACDQDWWRRYHDVIEGFTGERWTQDVQAAKQYNLNHVVGESLAGLGTTPGVIHFGGNSGYQAMNLAWQFGAARIVLIGYDMQRTGGKTHWFGDHPKGLNNIPILDELPARFRSLAADLRNQGCEVLNCTRETALDCFDRVTVDEAVCRLSSKA